MDKFNQKENFTNVSLDCHYPSNSNNYIFHQEDYAKFLNEFYKEFNKFEIEIIDGDGFKAAKYFDIRHNHWKLDHLVPSVLKAQELCQQIINKQL